MRRAGDAPGAVARWARVASDGRRRARWMAAATARGWARISARRLSTVTAMTPGRHRALFVCPALDNGGAERHWAMLIPALAARGLEARVVAIEGGGRALDSLRRAGVPVRELGVSGARSLGALPQLLRERGARPTAVVTWGYNAHALGATFARATDTAHVINWHRQPGFAMSRVQEGAVRLAGRAGGGVICVTSAQIPELQVFGFSRDAIRVVPNGAVQPAASGASRSDLRAELNLPPTAFVAVLVARLRPEKRVNDFVDALVALRQEVPDAMGVVVGDGPLETALRGHAESKGAPIRFAGFQPDPTRYMLAADAVCLTSEFEALPMVLVEAAASARPAVATDVGGAHDIVEDGVTGFLVPPGDHDALRRNLAKLAGNGALRARMGEAAQARWRRHYSFETMVNSYMRLLTTVEGPPARWPRSD